MTARHVRDALNLSLTVFLFRTIEFRLKCSGFIAHLSARQTMATPASPNQAGKHTHAGCEDASCIYLPI
ncbi:hypothetical protein CDEST_05100 [Colletotrichum destructivum]|uniref:Uncharacterized protein n=1 Tax=Colletotrichum destructivum TaxID=34406 RepID=A0AAX4IA84_9PEZI|nr:hypothetical protein CDEST_05100 [Colletotrichum destructivum]